MTDEQTEAVQEGAACTTELKEEKVVGDDERKVKRFKREELYLGVGIQRDTHEGVVNLGIQSFNRTFTIKDARSFAMAILHMSEVATQQGNFFRFFHKQGMDPEKIMGLLAAMDSESNPEGMTKTEGPPQNGNGNA